MKNFRDYPELGGKTRYCFAYIVDKGKAKGVELEEAIFFMQ